MRKIITATIIVLAVVIAAGILFNRSNSTCTSEDIQNFECSETKQEMKAYENTLSLHSGEEEEEVSDEEEIQSPKKIEYSQREYELLCKLVYAEETRAGYAQYLHDMEKVCIVQVVLNRVQSPEFPNRIVDVIFDTKNGVQFEPAQNGQIYWYPKAGEPKKILRFSDVSDETKETVKKAMNEEYPNYGYLFFYASKEDVEGKDRVCNTVFY